MLGLRTLWYLYAVTRLRCTFLWSSGLQDRRPRFPGGKGCASLKSSRSSACAPQPRYENDDQHHE
eukprot:5822498-Pleurochrysis_carterae.AAC.2